MKKQTSFVFPSSHPVFAGHFPSTPIVPGALLLDEVIYFIASAAGLTAKELQINSVKFLSPLKPDESASIEYEQSGSGLIKFAVLEGNRQIAIGSFTINPAASSGAISSEPR